MLPVLINEIKFNAFCHVQAKEKMLLAIDCIKYFFVYPISSNSNSSLLTLKGRCSKLMEAFASTAKAILLCLPLINKYVSFNNYLEFVKQQSYSPVSFLPDELLLKIFGELPPKDLGRVSCVSKRWNELASDNLIWQAFNLEKIFPSLKVIDGTVWQHHTEFTRLGLSVDDASPLDKRIVIPFLTRLFASLQIKGEAGITLLTIPKGLTINKIRALLECIDRIDGAFHEPDFLEEFKHISVEKTYTVAITNDILKGSEKLSMAGQQELIKKNGCEMPRALEAAALFALEPVRSSLSRTDVSDIDFWRSGLPQTDVIDLPFLLRLRQRALAYLSFLNRPRTHCCEQVNGSSLIVGPYEPYLGELACFYTSMRLINGFVTMQGCFIKEKQPAKELGSQYDTGLASYIGSFGVLKV